MLSGARPWCRGFSQALSQGRWLEQASFTLHAQVRIVISWGRLVIEVQGAAELIDTNIGVACQSQRHPARYAAVLAGVDTALEGKCVTVTALGCVVTGPAKEKSRIRQMDALIGNEALWAE